MYGGTIKDCHDNWLGGGAVCAFTAEPVSFIMDGGYKVLTKDEVAVILRRSM